MSRCKYFSSISNYERVCRIYHMPCRSTSWLHGPRCSLLGCFSRGFCCHLRIDSAGIGTYSRIWPWLMGSTRLPVHTNRHPRCQIREAFHGCKWASISFLAIWAPILKFVFTDVIPQSPSDACVVGVSGPIFPNTFLLVVIITIVDGLDTSLSAL